MDISPQYTSILLLNTGSFRYLQYPFRTRKMKTYNRIPVKATDVIETLTGNPTGSVHIARKQLLTGGLKDVVVK